MSWQGRDVVISFGGTPIDLSKNNEAKEKAIKLNPTRCFSFNAINTDAVKGIVDKAKYSATLEYPSGEVFKMRGMSLEDSEGGFDFTFNFKSLFTRRIMKTKGKQPRVIAVWRNV